MYQVSLMTLAESVGQMMGDAGMTILIGLVVVFSVLILLTFIFWLFGKVAGGRKKPARPAAPRAVVQETPKPAPGTSSGPSRRAGGHQRGDRRRHRRCRRRYGAGGQAVCGAQRQPFPLPAACLGVGRFV